MNELKYYGLTIVERVICYFELAKDAKLVTTESEMIASAIALMLLLQDSDVDRKAVADRLRKEAVRCGITVTAVTHTINDIERG